MSYRWSAGPVFMAANTEARWWVSGFHMDPTGVLVGVEPANLHPLVPFHHETTVRYPITIGLLPNPFI
jgi:hypothetical protein